MLMVKVGRDITAFSASSALPVFTAGLGGVCAITDFIPQPVLKHSGFRGRRHAVVTSKRGRTATKQKVLGLMHAILMWPFAQM